MSLSTQPYKGARDFYPEDKRIQDYMFGKIRAVVKSFGYQEYDAPILEPLDLYRAKTGDEIVNEQVYSFVDRGEREVAIRPEMTPTVSRMVAAKRQELAYPLRWFSIPNLWRYERPQRGRLREHWQLNVDLFGEAGLPADHEIIMVADAVLKGFGAKPDMYEIRINSRTLLFKKIEEARVKSDQAKVIRLVDAKDKITPEEFNAKLSEHVEHPDKLIDFLNGSEGDDQINQLLLLCKDSSISNVVFKPGIARGFDYYTDLVFEVFDTNPENNRSMFGGGRYDGLVGLFGVEPIPTVGFGMGDVTLANFLRSHDLLPKVDTEIDAVAILVGDVYEKAQAVLSELRAAGLNISVDATDRKLDNKLNHAEKSGVQQVIFIGADDFAKEKFGYKHFKSGEKADLDLAVLIKKLKA